MKAQDHDLSWFVNLGTAISNVESKSIGVLMHQQSVSTLQYDGEVSKSYLLLL